MSEFQEISISMPRVSMCVCGCGCRYNEFDLWHWTQYTAVCTVAHVKQWINSFQFINVEFRTNLIEWLIDWLTDWPIDWLTRQKDFILRKNLPRNNAHIVENYRKITALKHWTKKNSNQIKHEKLQSNWKCKSIPHIEMGFNLRKKKALLVCNVQW